MIAYLAGPMSGRPKFNYPAFDEAATELREQGIEIVSPAEMDDPKVRAAAMRSRTGNLKTMAKKLGETWGDFLSRDVKLIADSDINAIVLLPEWEQSRGARLEAFVCMTLGYPTFTYYGELQEQTYDRILGDINASLL